ncbi:alpha/beta fold hydrolase [Nocardia uniformis]|uniref:Alpha/beta fold hydrolase n=1 Tax=Nocardia uniformis TaxID=53432 RepID=A0A849C6L8_9NOCA|nr:alpha/beta fold hydrolase [Nocardia uniformis]NNH68621.1 alpha/beta fold hydrolase [Nocardia uniformis]
MRSTSPELDAGELISFRTADGVDLRLRRVGPADAPAVLLVHGHGVSSEMFALPEIRNVTDALADAGYQSWLLDWRGSSRLPHNTSGRPYTFDDVALYDLPAAVAQIRERIGDRPLFVVAHCIGALALALSMTGGLLPGLAGVVAQGVFLTPKVSTSARMRVLVGSELMGSRVTHIESDFRKVGLWNRRTLLYAALSRKGDCPDPTCRMVHGGWGMGTKLFEHDHLDARTHDRLADLFGAIPLSVLPHLRQMELAHAVLRWNIDDERYSALPQNALDQADRIDCPVLLLSGSRNAAWLDSNRLCYEVLSARNPGVDVRYTEIPSYGHLDTFIGRGAALDVFGYIVDFLDETSARLA